MGTLAPKPASLLVRACASAFTSRTGRHGRIYFEEGRVAIEGAEKEILIAAVRGSRPEPYRVAINFSEVRARARLEVECTCSYFFDGYPCKHIYATLLAIDAAGITMVDPGFLEGRLDVVSFKSGLAADGDWFFRGDQSLRHLEATPSEGPKEPEWEKRLDALRRSAGLSQVRAPAETAIERGRPRRVWYRLNPIRSEAIEAMVVEVWQEVPGTREPEILPLTAKADELASFSEEADRRALALLAGLPLATPGVLETVADDGEVRADNAYLVPGGHLAALLPALVATGRFELRGPEGPAGTGALVIDPGPAAELRLSVGRQDGELVLEGVLVRPNERLRLQDLQVALRDGWVVDAGRLVQADLRDGWAFARQLRKAGPLQFPESALPEVLKAILAMAQVPPLELPFPWRTDTPAPERRISFLLPEGKARPVTGRVTFAYGETLFSLAMADSGRVDPEAQVVLRRDDPAEANALAKLGALGLKRAASFEDHQVEARQEDLDRVVRGLVHAGWRVEAEGRRLRALSSQSVKLSSGQDWFDLSGHVEFEGHRVELPELLKAAKNAQGFVRLDDGTEGLLPEDWLKRYAALGDLGTKKGESLRFVKSQAILLDLLLGAQSDVELDLPFQQARERLRTIGEVRAQSEPPGFQGELRSYQKEGLGWLAFLAEVGLGGCLADDMGLGKTVQVLALLQARQQNKKSGPRASLVVAPRSLVYNWMAEAERFAPDLKVTSYTGLGRGSVLSELGQWDLVITTYGTVRRDIERLREIGFDYVILDEAQAIKNASAQSSKACRLLRAEHRLALSGTPVENHLLELWSIFEFLNPRMLGSRREFLAATRSPDGSALSLMARALRPMILRRTKGEVLKELPEKTELTLYCELEGDDERLYGELRDHYRNTLTAKIQKDGLEKSRIHVLEALLRLRQAACHPGLIDANRKKDGSAKLDTLLDQLQEIADEGHKALVFSQFVQLLDIVRGRLDHEKIPYAYLDGRTVDRESQVKRFQEDPDTRLFLISLKAGGLGLNLTAADYVFILDPWWNPAVEAQAIDRAHRIGQTRPVFAYRLIAKGTVEEKILDLHRRKKRLAEAIITDDAGLTGLTLEDLELLLS